jgi:hypothetical protein
MPDFRYFVLLVALLASGGPSRTSRSHKVDGGTLPARAVHSKPDGGIPPDRVEPDAGAAASLPAYTEQDAGAPALPATHMELDAGAAAFPPGSAAPDVFASLPRSVCPPPGASVYILPVEPKPDAGTLTFTDSTGKEIHWPERATPIVLLEGSAVVAANAALQHLVASFAKERPNACTLSAKAMDVMVSEQGGLYFVQIYQRVDRCGFRPLHPYASMWNDWFELYAVSPEGKVLARYPYCP